MVLARLILGLLCLSPMTGYELKKHFDSSINHFWNADKAQIYRTLAQLVEQGYATVRTVPQTNYPDRQEHHITEAGREVLNQWLSNGAARSPERDPFMGQVFFAAELEQEGIEQLLLERRKATQDVLDDYLSQREGIDMRAAADRRSFLMAATLDHAIRQQAAELEWLDAVLEHLP
ncbi:PadR family transcriptional regulator [Glutamicibacter sp. NPDC087344]|uniref:PadR family transcriptional regulator n=1 Tax=Glutamicibacter sp. NPDC087344 TaxID=3363994 RepID=UPI00381C2305